MGKKILIIATGGTIACTPGRDGLVPSLSAEALVKLVPGLGQLADLTCVELMALDSSNLEPRHWQQLARTLEYFYFDYDGFVVTHGTDTMAYTAAALTWMLQHCAKPVVLTGAQLPLTMPGSDAPANLRHAVQAATGPVSGVMLCFGNVVIGGQYASKMYTEAPDAFVSVNAEPWATLDDAGVHWSAAQLARAEREKNALRLGFKVLPSLETRVAAITLTPGLSPDVLRYYAQAGYRGLVLLGFGAGGVPNGGDAADAEVAQGGGQDVNATGTTDGAGAQDETAATPWQRYAQASAKAEPIKKQDDGYNWLPALAEVLERGVRVVCVSQCPFDGVNLHKYPIGTLAARLGAKSAGTMTLEAALTHLMWELGNP